MKTKIIIKIIITIIIIIIIIIIITIIIIETGVKVTRYGKRSDRFKIRLD